MTNGRVIVESDSQAHETCDQRRAGCNLIRLRHDLGDHLVDVHGCGTHDGGRDVPIVGMADRQTTQQSPRARIVPLAQTVCKLHLYVRIVVLFEF